MTVVCMYALLVATAGPGFANEPECDDARVRDLQDGLGGTPDVRLNTLRRFPYMEAPPVEVLDEVVPYLEAAEPEIRQAAIDAVAAYGTAASEHCEAVVTLLNDDSTGVRAAAARAMAQICSNAFLIEQSLRRAMADEKPAVRIAVLQSLFDVAPVRIARTGSARRRRTDARSGATNAVTALSAPSAG